MLIPEIDFCRSRHLEALDLLEKHCFPDSPWSFRIMERDLADVSREALFYLGAFWKGFLVGYAVFRPRKKEFTLLRIGVYREYRRQKIGAQLLDAGEVLAEEIREEHIFLEVRQENRNAREFYERMGYVLQGISTRNSGDPEKAPLVYRKRLSKEDSREEALEENGA